MALSPLQFEILTSLAAGRKHGYAVIGEARDHLGTVGTTTAYRAIERLEIDGMIMRDGDEIVDGRLRRFYRLSEQGASTLQSEARRMAETAARAVARVHKPVQPSFGGGLA